MQRDAYDQFISNERSMQGEIIINIITLTYQPQLISLVL